MPLPWETGSLMPWQVGQYFTDANGVSWQVYQDPASASGYTLKRTDQAGTSFQTGPTPADPNAAANAWEQSPYGQRYARYEEGLAQQNQFNNQLQLDTLSVKRQELRNQRDVAMRNARTEEQKARIQQEYQQGLIRIAEGELAIKQGTLDMNRELGRGDLELRGELGRGDLDVKRGTLDLNRELGMGDLGLRRELGYGDLMLREGALGLNTLQLGSQLRGPRDWLGYQRAASGASQNPMLTGAVDAWASLTGNRPTGLGAWGGGDVQPMTMNALAADFTGGGGAVAPGANGSPYSPEQQAFMQEADRAARNPNQLGAGWWEAKNPDQQQMYLGAWDSLGHSPDTVLNRYKGTRIGQSLSGRRAA